MQYNEVTSFWPRVSLSIIMLLLEVSLRINSAAGSQLTLGILHCLFELIEVKHSIIVSVKLEQIFL